MSLGGNRLLLVALVVATLAGGGIATADSPQDELRSAIDKTAAAKTAHVSLKQTTKTATRTIESSATGTLAHGDQDLVNRGDGGESRRVAVGSAVYEKRPNTPDAPWRTSSRNAPTQDTAFGALALRDGTSLGDIRLYRSIAEAGTETLTQGQTRKLVAELDMGAVATAMQLGPTERARLTKMTGTVTLWIASDGSVARHVLTLVIPTTDGGFTTVESAIDLSDLDAPLVITKP